MIWVGEVFGTSLDWKEQMPGIFVSSGRRKMGLSLDYTRERFTLDEGLK